MIMTGRQQLALHIRVVNFVEILRAIHAVPGPIRFIYILYMFYKKKNPISWVLLDIPSVHIILISIESTIWQLFQKLED